MRAVRELLIEIAIMVVIGVLLAALGPFGSFDSSFASRLAYWVPTVLVGYAIFRPTTLVAERISAALRLPRTAAIFVASLLAAVPATAAIAAIGGFRPFSRMSLDDLFQLYLNVALIGLVIGTVFLLIESTRTPRANEDAALSPADSTAIAARDPAFFDRLPPDWNRQLVALEMEDHYVRVHRANGRSTLLLMRMADAERELEGVDGTRVHRSWWVARGAVRRAERSGRSWLLQLEGGIVAPVARDRVAALREAGWL